MVSYVVSSWFHWIFLIFLIMIISIPSCYNYSLYKYVPEYTFEEDHRPTFECNTNIQETACNIIIGKVGEKNRYAIAGVLFELDIMHSPALLKKAMTEMLCQFEYFCKVSYFGHLYNVLGSIFDKMSGFDPDPMYQYNYFIFRYMERKVIREKIFSNFSNSDLPISEDRITEVDLSVSLLITLELCKYKTESELQQFLVSAKKSKQEIIEAKYSMKVNLLVGINYCSPNDYQRFNITFYKDQLTQILGDVITIYFIERESYRQSVIDYGKNGQPIADFRELLIQVAYIHLQSDYYIFLDEINLFPTSYWLITNLNHLFFQGFQQNFGIQFRGTGHFLYSALSTSLKIPDGTFPKQKNHHEEDLLLLSDKKLPMKLPISIYPTIPKIHIEIFQQIHVFQNQFPTIMNDILLMDLYSIVYSSMHFNTRNRVLRSETIDLLDPEIMILMDDYIDHLQFLRRHLLNYLNNKYYHDSPIIYFPHDIAFNFGDHFYEGFCSILSGCLGNDQSREQSDDDGHHNDDDDAHSDHETINKTFEDKEEGKKIGKHEKILLDEKNKRPRLNCPHAQPLHRPRYSSSKTESNQLFLIERISAADLFMSGWRIREMIDVKGYNRSLHKLDEYQRISYRSIYTASQYLPTNQNETNHPLQSFMKRSQTTKRVAIITAVYGSYERECRSFAKQSTTTDFYCFTDNMNIQGRGWIIDSIPYYLFQLYDEFESNQLDDLNIFHHNQHPFNIAKFFKQQFFKVPILLHNDYDVIIWIDGSVHVNTVETTTIITNLYEKLPNELMFVFEHGRNGLLEKEYSVSILNGKYIENSWINITQPIQLLEQQYSDYLQNGYSELYWEMIKQQRNWQSRTEYGVFLTCFLSFHMKRFVWSNRLQRNISSIDFLTAWSNENRKYSTQDQISYSYVIQQLDIPPFPFPSIENGVYGSYFGNNLFTKVPHDGLVS